MRSTLLLAVLLALTACRSGKQDSVNSNTAATLRVAAVSANVPGNVPINNASNLFGVYVVGRGSQVFSWTQPIHEDTSVNTNYSGYRLYWWSAGSSVTNYVDLTRDVQKVLMSGVAGANKPLTFISMTVLNGSLEGQASNTLLIPSEP